jgi:fructose-1,6-bisphosphatase III
MWYLWSGARSPLFGKSKMATFERYFLAEKETHAEEKNPYYQFRDRVATVRRILTEFGLDPETARIINGHVPVRVKRGESPIKADGQLLVIDGGFSKAYQQQTGIAGYTLIHNSYGFLLAAHEPFQSTQAAIEKEADIHSRTNILDKNFARMRVKDTDAGREFQRRIEELKLLLTAYRTGLIKESPAQR